MIENFYTLAILRRGDVDWGSLGSGVCSMTLDCRNASLVNYMRRNCMIGVDLAHGHV